MPTTLRIEDRTRDRYRSIAEGSSWELAKVREARALIVGCGALGNEVAKNLAMLGVREIFLVDKDTVELANLTRSVFFRECDHGRRKVDVLAEGVRELNSDVAVIPLHGDLESVVGLGLLRRMHLVFSCLDNRLARRSLNRMCHRVGKPWIDGAMENLLGDVTVFLSDGGPCYECRLSPTEQAILARAFPCTGIALNQISRGRVPTLSTMGSIIAALQVQQALRVYHGRSLDRLGGRRIVLNCEIDDFYVTQVERKGDCMGHIVFGEPAERVDWSVSDTTPQDLIDEYRITGGGDGHLRLGRDVVVGLECRACGITEPLGVPQSLLAPEVARCRNCNEMRAPITTNVVDSGQPLARLSLGRLGVPPLDILEVRGAAGSRWYELTRDWRSMEIGPGKHPEALT